MKVKHLKVWRSSGYQAWNARLDKASHQARPSLNHPSNTFLWSVHTAVCLSVYLLVWTSPIGLNLEWAVKSKLGRSCALYPIGLSTLLRFPIFISLLFWFVFALVHMHHSCFPTRFQHDFSVYFDMLFVTVKQIDTIERKTVVKSGNR